MRLPPFLQSGPATTTAARLHSEVEKECPLIIADWYMAMNTSLCLLPNMCIPQAISHLFLCCSQVVTCPFELIFGVRCFSGDQTVYLSPSSLKMIEFLPRRSEHSMNL